MKELGSTGKDAISEAGKQFGRRRIQTSEVVLVILQLVSLAWHWFTYLNGHAKSAEMINLCGMESGAVERELGPPAQVFTGAEYLDGERDRIAHSYEPDPPEQVADEVHQYRFANTMWLFFIEDGRVVRMYRGAT